MQWTRAMMIAWTRVVAVEVEGSESHLLNLRDRTEEIWCWVKWGWGRGEGLQDDCWVPAGVAGCHSGRPGKLVEEHGPAGSEFPYWPC